MFLNQSSVVNHKNYLGLQSLFKVNHQVGFLLVLLFLSQLDSYSIATVTADYLAKPLK